MSVHGSLLHHGNASANKAAATLDFLAASDVQLVTHSPSSPDLALSDWFLLPFVERRLRESSFRASEISDHSSGASFWTYPLSDWFLLPFVVRRLRESSFRSSEISDHSSGASFWTYPSQLGQVPQTAGLTGWQNVYRLMGGSSYNWSSQTGWRPAYPKTLLSVLQTACVRIFRFLTGCLGFFFCLFLRMRQQSIKSKKCQRKFFFHSSCKNSVWAHIFNYADALQNWHTLTLRRLYFVFIC